VEFYINFGYTYWASQISFIVFSITNLTADGSEAVFTWSVNEAFDPYPSSLNVDTWYRVFLDFSNIPEGQWDGVWFQNYGQTNPNTVYIDNVVAIPKKGSPVSWVSNYTDTPIGVYSTIKGGIGSYSFDIIDRNGCSTQLKNVAITQPAILQISKITTLGSLPNDQTGQVTINPIGGVQPYNISLSGKFYTGGNSISITSLATGNYTFSVSDSNGCYVQGSFSIPILVTTSNIVTSTSTTTSVSNVNTVTSTTSSNTGDIHIYTTSSIPTVSQTTNQAQYFSVVLLFICVVFLLL